MCMCMCMTPKKCLGRAVLEQFAAAVEVIDRDVGLP
jgi:hypothetical protein